jgi:hypothetical protein
LALRDAPQFSDPWALGGLAATHRRVLDTAEVDRPPDDRHEGREETRLAGLDHGFQIFLTASSRTLVRVVHFGQPARIEAFSGGSAVEMHMMAPTPGVEQAFTFTGSSIDSIIVTPAGSTLVIELCH